MINLPNVLDCIYENRSSKQISAWLAKYGFAEPLEKTVSQLNAVIANQNGLIKTLHSLPVGHIASNLLLSINQRIVKKKDTKLIAELENTISDVCLSVLKEFFKFINTDRKAIILQIDAALKDSCHFHNYDYNQLIRLLKLEAFISYLQTLKNSDKIARNKIPSYCWQGKPIEKANFLKLFKDRQLVKSKKGLALLFESPNESLELSFDPLMAHLTLQFFCSAKKLKLLRATGAGFYQVLAFHVQDFDKNFLDNKFPRARMNSLRQSKTQWNDNQVRIDTWMKDFSLPKNGLRTVHRT